MLNAMVHDNNLFTTMAHLWVQDAQSWNEKEMGAAHARLLQVAADAQPLPLRVAALPPV